MTYDPDWPSHADGRRAIEPRTEELLSAAETILRVKRNRWKPHPISDADWTVDLEELDGGLIVYSPARFTFEACFSFARDDRSRVIVPIVLFARRKGLVQYFDTEICNVKIATTVAAAIHAIFAAIAASPPGDD